MGASSNRITNALRRIGALRKVVRRVRGFVDPYKVHVWFLEGQERVSRAHLSILYMGQLENKNYIENLAFEKADKQDDLGTAWIWNAVRRTRCRRGNPDLIVMDLQDRHFYRFGNDDGFYIPSWMGAEFVLSEALARFKSREDTSHDPRRIRGSKGVRFEFEVTRSPEEFERFYSTMYVPYVMQRYGDQAFMEPYERIREEMDRSDLCLVKRDGDYVAGSIIIYEPHRVHWWILGVKDGNSDHVKAGAIAAMYYYKMLYCSEQGYESVYAGDTRAFLNDGVLQFKKGWGLRFTGSSVAKGFWLRCGQVSPGVNAFLINNPFVVRTDSGFSGAVFLESETFEGVQPLRQLHRSYYVPGMDRLNIYLLGGQRVEIPIPADLAGSMAVQSAPVLTSE
jgi:hypothetical protein